MSRERVTTWDELQLDGPPVRLRDLCRLTGFSKMKFIDDIERGDLEAIPVRTCRTKVWMIERSEARRYLLNIGFAA